MNILNGNALKVALIFLIGLLFPGIGYTNSGDKPTVIRIAYSGAGAAGRPVPTFAPAAAAAYHLGLFDEEFGKDNIRFEWSFFPGAGPATNEAHAAGLVDFGIHGDLPLIVGNTTGLKRKWIFSYGRFGNTYFVVPSDSKAKSLDDLKGKRLATFKGTAGQLRLARFLKLYGYSEKDFRVVSMNGESTRAALATRDIDGTLITPFSLEARGIAKTLINIRKDPTLNSVGTIWVDEGFEQKYPDIVQRFVKVLVKGAHWVSLPENRDAVFEQLAQSGIQNYNDFNEEHAGDDLRERYNPLLDEYYVWALEQAVKESLELGLIRKPLDIKPLIERKYLDNALKELKLEHYWDQYDTAGNIKPNTSKLAQSN